MNIQILGIEKLKAAELGTKALRGNIREGLRKETFDFGLLIVARAQGTYLRGRPGLNRVNNNLASRIKSDVRESTDYVTLTIGTNVIYGRIHELGGTIMAKKKPYLVFKGAGGKWASVKSVTIPKRPYLRPSIEDETPAFKRRVGLMLNDFAKKGFSGGL